MPDEKTIEKAPTPAKKSIIDPPKEPIKAAAKEAEKPKAPATETKKETPKSTAKKPAPKRPEAASKAPVKAPETPTGTVAIGPTGTAITKLLDSHLTPPTAPTPVSATPPIPKPTPSVSIPSPISTPASEPPKPVTTLPPTKIEVPTQAESNPFVGKQERAEETRIVLRGDRLRKYFPDVEMTPREIEESIYDALEERRQRQERQRQKAGIFKHGKSSPVR